MVSRAAGLGAQVGVVATIGYSQRLSERDVVQRKGVAGGVDHRGDDFGRAVADHGDGGGAVGGELGGDLLHPGAYSLPPSAGFRQVGTNDHHQAVVSQGDNDHAALGMEAQQVRHEGEQIGRCGNGQHRVGS